ncbi:hypothetical protein H2248_005251 [Termitomyces sp. 'cryptogamus']|nr:hypothetical protein H2248_005251 [Termitomyces sp. 'cryptogamus']
MAETAMMDAMAAVPRRHASFDSPFQVPLPSPSLFDAYADPFDDVAPPDDDRFSSASLPLPCNVPFQTLPRTDPAAHAASVRQAHRSELQSSSRSPSPPRSTLAVGAPSYPAPDPPTILAPTAAPGPFLSHAPPPPDSWIEVETRTSEYRLNVRLPGFKRDGITLASKRRRILHVVADCWENGGGHFERRISFGYDADLVQVRAEFDGEMLRISIPRRLPPVDLWRPAPIGRTS